mmetsp:Transcript_802/g.1014  ORF Transcript_802/g.1014 Transcript_802/m.1014 type:complete len:155 (-) Transcript_802:1707-2171(-)
MNEDDPKEAKFLIKWKNKLDIGDTNFYVLRNRAQGLKEIIISYKTIYINTYNVVCMDVSSSNEFSLIFRHESFQLWESKVKGFLMSTNEFMILSKDGINLISLNKQRNRIVKDSEGFERSLHSLGSCDYMKLEPTNHVLFACQFYENRQICLSE